MQMPAVLLPEVDSETEGRAICDVPEVILTLILMILTRSQDQKWMIFEAVGRNVD